MGRRLGWRRLSGRSGRFGSGSDRRPGGLRRCCRWRRISDFWRTGRCRLGRLGHGLLSVGLSLQRTLRKRRLGLIRVFRQQCASSGQKLSAVGLLLPHFLPPNIDHGFRRLAPVRHRFRQERHNQVATLDNHIGNGCGLNVPHGTRHRGGRLTGVVVDYDFKIARQSIVAGFVHRQHVSPRAR